MTKDSHINPILARELDQAVTCSQVAACLFPYARSQQAFLERDVSGLNDRPKIVLLDLNDDFWATTLPHTVYVLQESQFRQYNPQTGLYQPITESTLIGQLITNLNYAAEHFPSFDFSTFLSLKNRQRLKSVIERAKDLMCVDATYFKENSCYLNLANGFYSLADHTFTEHNPQHPIRDKMDVAYDPKAKCEMFLGAFLNYILCQEDIDLLQRYLGQILQGINYAQKILILTGDSGWGKSSLMKIIASILSWKRVGILREHIYRDGSEMCHYANKHLLYHPDMPTKFLNSTQSSIFKQLVGQDPIWAETKTDDRIVIEGNFPIVLACNGKPQIALDQDSEAWARRLIVLNFKKPSHDKHFGKLAELLAQERSGILNWMLEGRKKLVKDGMQLILSPQQTSRTNLLLLGSDSPASFVRCALIKKQGNQMGAVDLFEVYQTWCRKHNLSPFPAKQFHKTVKSELEMGLGLRYRHDLESEKGKAMRGWMNLGLAESGKTQKVEIQSVQSEVEPVLKAA